MRNHTGWLSGLFVLMLSVLSAVVACHATPSPSLWNDVIIKHKWDAIPDNWVSLGHPPNGTTVELNIVLKANRENALIDAHHEVSHPRHPKYGVHLSREQVAELAAPHPDTLELVFSWLEYHDVPTSSISMTHGDSWLTISSVPVPKANEILGASYEFYYHAWANATILRTASYSLPASLHTHVKIVAPTTAFTSTRILQHTPLSQSGVEAALENVTAGESSDVLSRVNERLGFVMPSFLRWLYGMPFNNPEPTDRNKLGIAGFANEFPSQQDLLKFMQRFRFDVDPYVAATRIVTVIPVNNGVDARSPPGKRGNIDTQYSVALTFPTPIEYYTIGGVKHIARHRVIEGDHYLEWLRYMVNMENVPLTISVPYSTRELDLPAEYARTLCDWFRDLGARGVSILVASGDEGIGSDFRRRRFQFSTGFPASCPYVTSVGGTTGFNPEIGSKFSGGGFSAFFGRMNYQNDAINAYLPKLGSRYMGLYNPLNRGVPDIAMQSMKYAVAWNSRITPTYSSTGFSTNTAAAIFALLNGFLVTNNRPPLGFLNYWLYDPSMSGYGGLNDIISGNNPGFSKTEGFFATDGWDPVTGLGSLNYTLLVERLISQ